MYVSLSTALPPLLNARLSETKEFNTMIAGPSVIEEEPATEPDPNSDLPF